MMAVACGGFFPAAATAQSYQLVTSTSDLESGKRYLIVAKQSSNYYAWAGLDLSDKKGKVTSVSPNGNVITPTEAVVPVQLVKSNDGWMIIDTNSIVYVGTTSEGSALLVGDSAPVSFTRFLWTISIDGGTTKIDNFSNKTPHYLKYDEDNNFFRSYGESEKTDISLYKEVLTSGSPLTLYDGIDNKAIIDAANGSTFDVTLKNRKFFEDGKWNTLCLPFSLTSLTGTPLDGATIMELDKDGNYKKVNDVWAKADDGTNKTGFDANSGTLYLFFKTATSIVAGKPYIIKWDNASGTIDSPIFSNVKISNTTSEVTSQDEYVTFQGGYNVKPITGVDQSILFLGSNNNVYYPSAAMNINAFRAYFQLNGITAGEPYSPESGTGNGGVRSFALSFGDNETSSIENVQCSMFNVQSEVWYTLDGRRLDGKPTARGIYVNSGRKVVVK